jgi:hypothetical protein
LARTFESSPFQAGGQARFSGVGVPPPRLKTNPLPFSEPEPRAARVLSFQVGTRRPE